MVILQIDLQLFYGHAPQGKISNHIIKRITGIEETIIAKNKSSKNQNERKDLITYAVDRCIPKG